MSLSIAPLWHYTCAQSHSELGGVGQLRPLIQRKPVAATRLPAKLSWMGRLVWLTDLPRPAAAALGLTRFTTACDRTEHRYRVTSPRHVESWSAFCRRVRPNGAAELNLAPGAAPLHWFVSERPVPVVYDPVQVAEGLL